MTPKRRALMMKVMDGCEDVAPYLYHIDKTKKCDEILKWLIENHLIGKEFLNWIDFHFKKQGKGASILSMIEFSLTQIDSHRKSGIFLGRDYH